MLDTPSVALRCPVCEHRSSINEIKDLRILGENEMVRRNTPRCGRKEIAVWG
jgi:hypothetical protein